MGNEVFVILDDYCNCYERWHDSRVVGVCSTEDLAKKKIRELGKTLEDNRDHYDELTWDEDGLGVERDKGHGYRQSFYAIKYKVDYFEDSPS